MQGEPQAAGADDRRRYVGAYIIGMIEAGLVATGMQGFWVRAVVGLVFLAAVVFHLTMEDSTRARALLKFTFGRPALRLREEPEHSRNGPEQLQNQDQARRYLPRVD
jgi:simple sugar transport system permease protein